MKLIDLDEALEAFGLSEKTRKYGGDHSGYDTRMFYEIQNTLESLPFLTTGRCEDCKHFEEGTVDTSAWCYLWSNYCYDNDFCSYFTEREAIENNG